MFLELSEVFVCPACRPVQGLVVLVDAIEERRVREGSLGCPQCELTVPIREGVLRFDLARDGGADGRPGSADAAEPPPALLAGVDREEAATRLAALLGADGAEGVLLLGPGLEGTAAPLSRRAPAAEVLALQGRAGEPGAGGGRSGDGGTAGSGDEGVSRAVGIRPDGLPIVTGRLAGVALLRPQADAVSEAVRVLEEGGRLVLLEPSRAARDALEGAPAAIAADEEAAVVAVREPGPARARGRR